MSGQYEGGLEKGIRGHRTVERVGPQDGDNVLATTLIPESVKHEEDII